jgi:hypothetical protein
MKRLILWGLTLALFVGVPLLYQTTEVKAEARAKDLDKTLTMSATTGNAFGVLGQAASDTLVGTATYDIVEVEFFYADAADSTDLITLGFKYGATTWTMKQRVSGTGTTSVGPFRVRADSIFVTTTGAQAADWYYELTLDLDL